MDDFLEGDDAFSEPQRRPAAARRRPTPASPRESMGHRRQIMQRRLTAFGAGILIIILLVLGVRGCLDARKTRAFENYASDLTTLVNESNQLAEGFFGRLEDPGKASDLSFEAEVNADRGTAEGLLTRAQSLDAPDEIAAGQSDVVLAFELRRDGLARVGDQIKTALGDKGRNRAIRQIARDMRLFLASDVLYERGRAQVLGTLEAEEVDATVPESQFLPNNPDYLDGEVVEAGLTGVSGGGNVSGVHGMGLISVSVAGVALTQGAEATVTGTGAELAAEVQNQGEATESDVVVRFTLSGGGDTIRGQETISTIAAGESQTVTLPISPPPPAGTSMDLEVEVEPVPGERVEDNNVAEYVLIFN